jgi:hypothetical protein
MTMLYDGVVATTNMYLLIGTKGHDVFGVQKEVEG